MMHNSEHVPLSITTPMMAPSFEEPEIEANIMERRIDDEGDYFYFSARAMEDLDWNFDNDGNRLEPEADAMAIDSATAHMLLSQSEFYREQAREFDLLSFEPGIVREVIGAELARRLRLAVALQELALPVLDYDQHESVSNEAEEFLRKRAA